MLKMLRRLLPLHASLMRKFWRKPGAQWLFRPVKVRFGRGYWNAERLPNLAEAQLLGVAQQHDRAGMRGQHLNRFK